MENFLSRFVGLEWILIIQVMLQIFLFYYEYTVKVNKSFKIFQCIDDVLAINADLIDIFEFTYLCCLKIKKAYTSNKNVHFFFICLLK